VLRSSELKILHAAPAAADALDECVVWVGWGDVCPQVPRTCIGPLRGTSRPHRRQHRAPPRRVWASAGADNGGEVAAELPVHFELPLAVLLAGSVHCLALGGSGFTVDRGNAGKVCVCVCVCVWKSRCRLSVHIGQHAELFCRTTLTVHRFAFEAYNEPVGGVLDKDTSGTTVAFMSKFVQQAYRGVLQVLPPPSLFYPPAATLTLANPNPLVNCEPEC
jgi:hypothetical protein